MEMPAKKEIDETYTYIDAHFDEHLEETREYLRIPSNSLIDYATDTDGKAHLQKAANFVVKMLRTLCIETKIVPFKEAIERSGEANPGVYGKVMSKNPKAKTLAVYGMYDVMPVERDRWKSPPFEAKILDAEEIELSADYGKVIVARGASNQKAPFMAFFNAVKSILAATGDIPVNLLFTVDGEEELGSTHLPQLLQECKVELKKAEAVLGPSFGAASGTMPAPPYQIILGYKGIVTFELECMGGEWGGPAEKDLTSYHHAWVDAPCWRLASALATMKKDGEGGKVIIDGFYDDVQPTTPEEKQFLEKLKASFNEEKIKKNLGIRHFKNGLSGKDLFESFVMGPVLSIGGIVGGYTGPAVKTNLPMSCRVKMDVRLVPNQKADDILGKIRRHLDLHGFYEIKIQAFSNYDPMRTALTADVVQAAIRTMEKMGVQYAIWPTLIASAPRSWYSKVAGIKHAINFGLGMSGNNHSQNEYCTVNGIRETEKYYAAFLYEYAKM